MKKILEFLGISILICFSFILTDKTTDVIKDNDEIMVDLKKNNRGYEILSIDAKVDEDEIIPGVSGKIIDLEKSYQAMKKIGTYNDSLIVYKEVEPIISLKDNYDKYIVSGNNHKNMVSLIFKLNGNINVNYIIGLIDNKNIDANFFVTVSWSKKNIKMLKKISDKYIIGNMENYNNENNRWLNSFIKRLSNQNRFYCYSETKNELLLKQCSDNKMYTILPSLVLDKNLLSNVKKEVNNGTIISIEINNNTLKELSSTIDYIISKGYKIVDLDTLLEE